MNKALRRVVDRPPCLAMFVVSSAGGCVNFTCRCSGGSTRSPSETGKRRNPFDQQQKNSGAERSFDGPAPRARQKVPRRRRFTKASRGRFLFFHVVRGLP